MPRVMITDSQGAWTGQWFNTATAQNANPKEHRRHGQPLQLWRTQGGTYVLVNLRGTEASGGVELAVIIPEIRALAILYAWGHTLTNAQRDLLLAEEV